MTGALKTHAATNCSKTMDTDPQLALSERSWRMPVNVDSVMTISWIDSVPGYRTSRDLNLTKMEKSWAGKRTTVESAFASTRELFLGFVRCMGLALLENRKGS